MGWVADYSWARPDPHALAGLGCVGAVRYLCYDGNTAHGKILFPPELAALRAAGLAVALVWEVGEADAIGGAGVGHEHGTEANRQADALGFPRDRPIYYAFDTDDRGQYGWQQLVAEYLDAARSAGQRAVGIYGSVRVVDDMLVHGHAAYGWQTESWSGSAVSTRACLLQHPDPRGSFDRNTILRADWGQTPFASTPPPAPTPEMMTMDWYREPTGRVLMVVPGKGMLVIAGDLYDAFIELGKEPPKQVSAQSAKALGGFGPILAK